jgi:LPS-assembly lipoprotein
VVVESAAAGAGGAEALADAREKSVVASTAAGQVRELQLRLRLRFALRARPGARTDPAERADAQRDMSYSETQALAKEQEEAAALPRRCRPTSSRR